MKVIMYHYVREYDDEHPNFRFLDIKNFRKQLDYFESNYGFVTRREWDSVIRGKLKVQELCNKVVLTFDDAMVCHFDYVYPELKKRGLWGIFYVPSMPYIENKMLDVHRIHLLCGRFNGLDLYRFVIKHIKEYMIPDSKKEEFNNMTYTKQKNYEGVSEFKRVMNYFIDYQYRSEFIDFIAASFKYEFNVEKFYVTKSALKMMQFDGNIIGSHTNSHPVMSKKSYQEQKHELEASFKLINSLTSNKNETYCHPYGGFHSFDNNTINLLSDMKVKYAFNVESRDLTDIDLLTHKHCLPRYDCNEFPNGNAS
jgi:peptidoglycan/xylan/chitin deacetylase (PgdA/CDA1 family)